MKKKKTEVLPVRESKEIREKLRQAGMLLQIGRLAQADYLCQEVIQKHPQEPQAWFCRGVIAHQGKKMAEAVGFLEQALQLYPGNVQFLQALAAVHTAMQNHKAAAEVYARLVDAHPGSVDAYFNRGIALSAMGQPRDAILSFMRALELEPRHWRAALNCGLLQQTLNDHSAAVNNFERALQLEPGEPSASYSMGVSLHHLERHAEALDIYKRILGMYPNHADTHNACASTLLALREYPGALDHYDAALRLNPLMTDAYLNKGLALYALLRFEEALDCYQKVLSLDVESAEVHYHMANAFAGLQRHKQALDFYGTAVVQGFDTLEVRMGQAVAHARQGDHGIAIQLLHGVVKNNPKEAQAYNLLALCHHELGQQEQAVHYADLALQVRPDFAEAYRHRGVALYLLGAHAEALDSFDAALRIEPDFTDAHFSRGHVLMAMGRKAAAAEAYAVVLKKEPQFPYALGYLVHAQLHQCLWDNHDRLTTLLQENVRSGQVTDVPFSFLSVASSMADQRTCAMQSAQDKYPPKGKLWNGERYGHARIRIGYASADFHDHATAQLMAELFELHDRSTFEIYAFSYGRHRSGAMRERLERAFDHFLDVGHMTDQVIAQQMHTNQIDILVDLKGYTTEGRLGIFAWRPAPVQVSYLGYPGTLGVEYVDYVLGDEVVTPFEHAPFYSEKIVQLPGSYQVNDRLRAVAPHTPSRADVGLPGTGFVFCCFNNNYKITPEIFDIWMRLLSLIDGSVLWLLQDNEEAAANLRKEALQRGVDASRLVFAPRLPLPEHLARQRLADLFLDTLPYNAHTTCSDALWVGLPVLTCSGKTFAGRVATSLLLAVDMPELICTDLAAYEARALHLARQPEELRLLRSQLEQGRLAHALFDTERFRQGLESAFRTMYERQRSGLAPEAFRVSA